MLSSNKTSLRYILLLINFVFIEIGVCEPGRTLDYGSGYAALLLINDPTQYKCRDVADNEIIFPSNWLPEIVEGRLCGDTFENACFAKVKNLNKKNCNSNCYYKITLTIPNGNHAQQSLKEIIWIKAYDILNEEVELNDVAETTAQQSILFAIDARVMAGLCANICTVTNAAIASNDGQHCIKTGTCINEIFEDVSNSNTIQVTAMTGNQAMNSCEQTGGLTNQITNNVGDENCLGAVIGYSGKALKVDWVSYEGCSETIAIVDVTSDETSELCGVAGAYPITDDDKCGFVDETTGYVFPCGAKISFLTTDKCESCYNLTLKFPTCKDETNCADTMVSASAIFKPVAMLSEKISAINPQIEVDERIWHTLVPKNMIICSKDNPTGNQVKFYVVTTSEACDTTDGYTQLDNDAVETLFKTHITEWPFGSSISNNCTQNWIPSQSCQMCESCVTCPEPSQSNEVCPPVTETEECDECVCDGCPICETCEPRVACPEPSQSNEVSPSVKETEECDECVCDNRAMPCQTQDTADLSPCPEGQSCQSNENDENSPEDNAGAGATSIILISVASIVLLACIGWTLYIRWRQE